MKNSLAFILLPLIIVSACQKRTTVPDPLHDPPTILPLIWKTLLQEDSLEYTGINPIIYNDILISSHHISEQEENETIIGLNKDNGNLLWEWSDFPSPQGQYLYGPSKIQTADNILFGSTGSDIVALDILSGNKLWSSSGNEGSEELSQFNTLLFHTLTYGVGLPFGDSSHIQMADMETGIWNTVFSLELHANDFLIELTVPSLYINENQDSLLIFLNKSNRSNTNIPRIDAYCYNMSQDSIVWYKYDLTYRGASKYPPTIDGDNVIIEGDNDMQCINSSNGEVIWIQDHKKRDNESPLLIYNNVIITVLQNSNLVAINKFTGEIVYNINMEDELEDCEDIRIHGDRIYIANKYIYIFDVVYGMLLYKIESPHENGSFTNGVAVDVAANKMYASDGNYMMCMELPE